MTVYRTSTGTRRMLDPHQVDKLLRHGMQRLTEAGMVFTHNGRTAIAGISHAKLARIIREHLRQHDYDTVLLRIDQLVDSMIGGEWESHRHTRDVGGKKRPPRHKKRP
ncbi:hypothetical protein [Microbacterium sp.]|uniref:hypothetical protein n=1 Tax=Microbacterium sp. TaxID=51671 RepID=UPI002CC00BA4|nr:hypothetical protein [Microbacterium sp.]HWL76781.1 hypothetical protein [Microbacterium sp.]